MLYNNERFIQFVRPYLKDCSNVFIAHHLNLAARTFFRRTRIYRPAFTPINVVANQAGYTVTAPAGYEVTAILEVNFEGAEIKPRTRAEARRHFGQSWETDTAHSAEAYVQTDEHTLTLVPIPDRSITAGLTGTCAVQPTLLATGIPTEIFNKYGLYIAYGALADLMSMSKKPWSSQDAVKYAVLYQNHENETRDKVERDFGDRDLIASGNLW